MNASQRKGDKRDRTTAKLIEAASQVIAEKGFERTSLEEVAKRAGMTRGAIYGNFRSREDLLLAVAEKQWAPIAPVLKSGGTLREQMRILGEAVVAAIPERQARSVGAASFVVYALAHEDLRTKLAKANAEIYGWAEEELSKFIPESELPMPLPQFVRVLHALTEGLLSLHFLTPELISNDVIVAAFEALA
jgi:AcrR family transcriptional regulator